MTQSALPARLLPTRIKAAHGLGSVTLGIKESGLTTFFMIYYNQVLGFDPRVVSLILIGAMFVDAMVDPLIGRLSDATRTRLGRRLPWLYGAALPMAIAWTLDRKRGVEGKRVSGRVNLGGRRTIKKKK